MKLSSKEFLIIILLLLTLTPVACANVILNSSLTHKYNVAKGGEYNGKLVVANIGSETVAVKLFKRDYLFNAEGYSSYLQPGTLQRSNSRWIEINRSQVYIPGGAEKEIAYNIKVPLRNELTGTYWSIIIVEPVSTDAHKPFTVDKEKEIGVQQHFRYGVQIVTNIGNSGKCNLQFKNPGIIKNDEHYAFLIDCINKGDRWLTPLVWLELYTYKGEKINRYYGQELRIYPGTSVCQQIKLDNIKPGEYKAVLIADGGNSAVFGSRYNLEISQQ